VQWLFPCWWVVVVVDCGVELQLFLELLGAYVGQQQKQHRTTNSVVVAVLMVAPVVSLSLLDGTVPSLLSMVQDCSWLVSLMVMV